MEDDFDFGDDSDFDWDSVDASDEPAAKKQRLFPGPAGVLPKIKVTSKIAPKLAKIKDTKEEEEVQETSSNLSQSEVLSQEDLIDRNKAWQAMKNDEICTSENSKYTSDYITKEAMEGMALKIPIFFCVIKTMDISSGLDVKCELMDLKGSLNGLLRREVINDYGEELRPSTALILKDLVVYTPKNGPPLINIAKKTIVSMFCNDPSGFSVRGEPVTSLSKEDIRKLRMEAERANRIAKNAVKQNEMPSLPNSQVRPLLSIQRPSMNHPRPNMNYPRPNYPRPSMNTTRPNFIAPPRPNIPRPNFNGPRFPNGNARFQHPSQPNFSRPAFNNPPNRQTSSQPLKIPPENNELLDGLDEESLFGDF